MQIKPELTFNLKLSVEAVLAVHRGLVFAKEYGEFPAEDPVVRIADSFSNIVASIQDQQSMLGALSLQVDLSVEPPEPKQLRCVECGLDYRFGDPRGVDPELGWCVDCDERNKQEAKKGKSKKRKGKKKDDDGEGAEKPARV